MYELSDTDTRITMINTKIDITNKNKNILLLYIICLSD